MTWFNCTAANAKQFVEEEDEEGKEDDEEDDEEDEDETPETPERTARPPVGDDCGLFMLHAGWPFAKAPNTQFTLNIRLGKKLD